jgi:putative transposase
MSKSKHTEAQIIAVLKQVEAGRTGDDVARERGVSKHTIYAWKAKFGGMDASEAQKLRALEDENGRLKRLVADLSLDREMAGGAPKFCPRQPNHKCGCPTLPGFGKVGDHPCQPVVALAP